MILEIVENKRNIRKKILFEWILILDTYLIKYVRFSYIWIFFYYKKENSVKMLKSSH